MTEGERKGDKVCDKNLVRARLTSLNFTCITEGERKVVTLVMRMLVLSSLQVRRSTRQGRLVTVACHCISRPLTWARSWQRGMGGRKGGAEAQMPPDVPTHGPKLQALTDLGKTEEERKGFGSSRPFGDQGQFGCPGRIAVPSIHFSVYGCVNAALRVCWARCFSILT